MQTSGQTSAGPGATPQHRKIKFQRGGEPSGRPADCPQRAKGATVWLTGAELPTGGWRTVWRCSFRIRGKHRGDRVCSEGPATVESWCKGLLVVYDLDSCSSLITHICFCLILQFFILISRWQCFLAHSPPEVMAQPLVFKIKARYFSETYFKMLLKAK